MRNIKTTNQRSTAFLHVSTHTHTPTRRQPVAYTSGNFIFRLPANQPVVITKKPKRH